MINVMKKWIIIEDEVDKAKYAIETLREKKEDFCWVYANNNEINEELYPDDKPDVQIKSTEEFFKLQDIFNNNEEIVVLLDIELKGIIDSQDQFKSNLKYLKILSQISLKKKYYLGIYSTKVSIYQIKKKLNESNIENIYSKDDFTESQETVNFCIQEIIDKWNSLYESITMEQFIKEFDKIKNSTGGDPNFHVENEEYVQGRDLIKRLIRLDDSSFNTICSLKDDNIFSGFLKGLFERKGISLFGIYLIAWAVYAKKFNNHELFLEYFHKIKGNIGCFAREKMFLNWENDESKKVEYLNQIYEMFEYLFSCNHFLVCENKKDECATQQSVLKDLQIDTDLYTLSFDLCINGNKFNNTFDSKVNSLFNKNYSSKINETCEKILMVMKNTWGKDSGISFETVPNNYLKIKFYIA